MILTLPYKIQLLITWMFIYDQYNSTYAKAILGQNVPRVQYNEYRSVIAIATYFEVTENPEMHIICTGTMITSFHCLTAEHCFYSRNNEIILFLVGSDDIRESLRRYPVWWMSYAQWASHFSHPITYQDNDIAVVKLDRQVPFFIIPSPLSRTLIPQMIGWEVTIAGWGVTDNIEFPKYMRKATLTVISQHQCNEIGTAIEGVTIAISENWFCSIANPYVLLEFGDSGGPVFDRNNTILGVNIGNCPKLNDTFHAGKANIHIAVALYTNYLSFAIEE